LKSTEFLLLLIISTFSYQVKGQVPIADFNSPTEVCLEEQFQIENNSLNAESYEWFPCVSSFEDESPEYSQVSNNSSLVFTYGVQAFKYEGSIYAFGARNAGILYNFVFDETFSSITNVNTYDVPSGSFASPRDVGYAQVNSEYIAFVSNSGALGIAKFDFGNSPLNDPVAENIESGTDLQRTHAIEVIKDTSLYVLVGKANSNKVYRLEYDTTDLANPVIDYFEISDFNDVTGLSTVKLGNQWYGLASSASSNKTALLSFGKSLSNNPSILDLTIGSSINVSRVHLEVDQNIAYGFLQSIDGKIVKLSFDDLNVATYTEQEISSYTGNTVYPIGSIEVNGERFIYHVDLPSGSRKINKFLFSKRCNNAPIISTEIEPIFSYYQEGSYQIQLTAFDSDGNFSNEFKSIEVLNSAAPLGDISTDSVYCIADIIDYNFETSDDIATYNWNFGDSNTSTSAKPTHQYSNDGEYVITLEVESTDGCPNIFYDTLTVVPEPQPEFSTIATEYCSFEAIDFSNDTPFDFGENVEWFWDFNGEGISTEENPSFTFESAGTKTIILEVNVLGCVETFQSTLEIIDGPQPDFEYDQNCIGETIQFTNLSAGANITSYQWDFGNGESSTAENPQTIYSSPGNYTIELRVSNASGCENTTTRSIQIFDEVVDSIMSTEAIENLPFKLGVDWVNDFDSTQNLIYEWEIDGEIQTVDTATYILSQGTYIVNLEVINASNCVFSTSRTLEVGVSESPTPDFNLPAEVCLEEQFQIDNTSLNADGYEWYFCESDFADESPVYTQVSNNSNLVFTYGVEVFKYEGGIYAFGARNAGIMYNFVFDEAFSSITNVTTYDVASGFFASPRDVGYAQVNSDYIAFVSNSGTLGITRLDFGNSPLNDPVAENIESGTDLQRTHSIEVIKGSSLYVLAGKDNSNRVYRLKYDTTDLNNAVEDYFEISDFSDVTGLSIKKLGSKWYGLASSVTSNKSALLSFGVSLSNNPSITDINIASTINVSRTHLVIDQNKAFGFLQSTDGTIVRLTFDDLNSPSFTEDVISSYSGNTVYPIGSIEVNGESFLYNVDVPNGTNKLNRFSFSSECYSASSSSTEIIPQTTYSQPGTYPITLTATHPNGNTASITKEITVTNNQAPDITFSTGDNLCITNSIAFNSTSAADITSYNWDFGDGNTSTAENPNHTYTAAGTYAVKLSVTDANGCNNSFQDSIRVFEEPAPDFQATAQGSICSQKPIIFENLTTLPTEATFEWDLGDGSTSTAENPEHIYSEAGDYTVTQIIEMAGCLVERTKTITVNPGPAVAFQTANNCLGEILKFENTSQGEFLDSYQWDFGDGTQSTQANPNHSYDTAGVYNVQLTAFTTNGCDFTISQEVEIQPLALVNFDSEIACAGQPTQFMEQVNIEESNVTDYLWDFGVLGTQSDVSTEANPQFTYPAEGNYNVTLQVTTSDGCTSSGSQQIIVNSAPNAAFEFEETCLGQTRLFSPVDTANSINHFWELQNNQGEILQTSQSTFFSYLFTEAGNYQLSYRQENENLCSQATTQTIEINEQPVPDFIWGTACVDEPVSFENLTDLNGNRLKNYNWSIEGTVFSSDLAPQYTFEESGNYQLTLEVETQGVCIQNISKNLLVSSKPTAFFELEQSIGAYPFALNLMMQDNPNEEIVEVFWILNEDTISNSSELNHIITEPGTYLLGLTVINEAGCENEYYEQIKVREPSLEVSLSNLRIKKDQEFTSFILNISNRGSLVPERIDLTIDFGEYSLTESLEAQIYPEENRNFSLSTRLTDEQLRGLSKICISASPKAGERKDANLQNNRICTNIENGFKVMDIYPNPTVNQFTIPLIIPENETIAISMEDSNGRQVKFYNYNLEAGYNEVQIQRENLSPGIYFLRFRYQGQEEIKKIIFQ